MSTRWVFRNSDGMWMVRDAGDAALILTEPQNYTEVTLAQDTGPDPRTTRGQTTPPYIRAATAPERAAYDDIVRTAEVTKAMDADRLTSAIVWTILDTYTQTAPATIAKYNSARTKIITAYKAQPWKA